MFIIAGTSRMQRVQGTATPEYERLKLRLQDAQQKLDKVLSEKSDVGQQGPHKTGKDYTTT